MPFSAVHPFVTKGDDAPIPGLTDDLKSWIQKEVRRQVQAEIATEIATLRAATDPWRLTVDASDTHPVKAAAESPEKLPEPEEEEDAKTAKRAPKVHLDMEAAIAAELEREIEATAWESLLLAFVDGLSLFDSMSLLFSSTINAVVQVVFVLVLVNSFLRPELPELKEIENWRLIYGHDKKTHLETSVSSLVSAVCSGDESLIISAAQQELFGMIEDYNTNFVGMPIGAVLCVLVLFLWFLLVGQEVAGSLSLMTTLFSLMSGETRLEQIPHWRQSDRPFVLTSVSRLRMVFVVIMTVIRLFICLSLLFVGSIFLANTLSISEMVLNAVALVFILDIDELVFDSFTSTSGKALRSNLQPLKRPPQALWANQLFSFFGSIVVVSIITAGWVSPNISLMTDIKDAMCGGNQDFIIAPAAWGLHTAIATKPFDPEATSFGMEMVSEAWHSDAESPSKWSEKWAFFSGWTAFNSWVLFSNDPMSFVDFYGEFTMSTCDDFPLSEKIPYFKKTLEHQTGIAEISNCSAAASFCGGDVQLLQLLCPVTCGCHDPLSGLFRSGKAAGCPVETCRQSSHYKAVLDSLSCEDMDAASLAADPAWARFWEDAVAFRGRRSAEQLEMWTDIKGDFMASGCGAYARLSGASKKKVCHGGVAEGGIASFCPVTCGCSGASAPEGCASACLSG